ncbi:hypothetical protein [Streptomyces hokutonensis]|uniref:hypothetical protein n=1 Tax=Streptomyces hokutonensis TaxID=1306990 RepID=UPI00131A1072|nr:hypothetical protein [Streptomyces hokutonensis]
MGEQWGNIVVALIVAVSALGGTFLGRRQVADEAAVEHGQWLRGQRQEAFAALLVSWDDGLKQLDDLVGNWEGAHYAAEHFQGNGWEELEKSIREDTHEAFEAVKRVIERVQLLGPPAVDDAAVQLVAALTVLRDAVRSRAGGEDWPDWDAYAAATERVVTARDGFLQAAKVATQEAPRPGSRRRRDRFRRRC